MLTSKFWEKYFKVYDVLNELYPYQDLARLIVNRLEVREGEQILDLGSGTGNIAMLVKGGGGEINGIDISSEGIKLHKAKDSDARLIVGDISAILPYQDAFFDKLYSNNALYTISRNKREDIFKELYRVLKPGGKIIISNVKEGFEPFAIYKDHVSQSVKKLGFFKTVFKMIKFVGPTVKILYYNKLITQENTTGQYDFFKNGEQREMLEKAGFINVDSDVSVYSDQGVLSSAVK